MSREILGSLKRVTFMVVIVAIILLFLELVFYQIMFFGKDYVVLGKNEFVSTSDVEGILDDLKKNGYKFNRNLVVYIDEGEFENSFFDNLVGRVKSDLVFYSEEFPLIDVIILYENFYVIGNEEYEWKSTFLHELGHYFEKELSEEDLEKWVVKRGFADGKWTKGNYKRITDKDDVNYGEIVEGEWKKSYNEIFADDLKALLSYDLGFLDIEENEKHFVTLGEGNHEKSLEIIAFFEIDTFAEQLSINELNQLYGNYGFKR